MAAESLEVVDENTPKRAKTAPAAPEALGAEEGAAASAAVAPAGGEASPFVDVSLYDCDTEEEEEEEAPLPPPAVSEKHPSPRKGAPLCELALQPPPARPMCCVA